MPTIQISNQLGLDLNVTPDPNSAIAKYIKSPVLLLQPGADLARAFNERLDEAPIDQFSSGLTFTQGAGIGPAGTELTVAAGASITFAIAAKPGDKLAPDRFRAPVAVGKDEVWLALGVKATLSPEISSEVNDLSFGFESGTETALYNYRRFSRKPAAPLLSEALQTALAGFTIPGDVEDLAALPPDAVAAVSGKGSLKVSATAELAQSMGLFTGPELPAGISPLKVKAGGSVSVGASFEITGAYELRIRRRDENTVELGYYTKQGEEFDIRATAKAQLTAKIGTTDLIPVLLRAISADPQADEDALSAAGLDGTKIANIEAAIQAGIDRSLAASLRYEFGALHSDEAAFLYEISPARLSPEGRRAVHSALDGDLSLLHELEDSLPQHGIRLVRSILTAIRERKHTFKVNLLGIYNVISVSDLIVKGEVLYEPDGGGLTIADQVSAKRIRAAAVNFAADSEKLRRVTAEHFLITAAYKASGFASGPEFSSSHSYFEYHRRTNRQTMKDNLDAVEAVGIIDAGKKQELLGPVADFGTSTFLLEAIYSDQLCRSLFLRDGQPRRREEYERIGRDGLAALVEKADPDGYRLEPVTSDTLWAAMCAAGPAALRSVLPAQLKNDDIKPAVIAGDYVAIRWWSESMDRAAQALAAVRTFLDRAGTLDEENNEFKVLRKRLSDCLASVARNASEHFGDPWGLVVMDMAADRKAELRARIGCALLTLAETRPKTMIAGSGNA